MADPLSISASIAGLVTLADLVFRLTTKYAKGVQGSRKEVEALAEEIKSLSIILHNLSLVASGLEIAQDEESTAAEEPCNIKPRHLHDCQAILLEKGLGQTKSQMTSNSTVIRIQSRLKWPFSSTETKTLFQDLQRHKQTLELALAADSLGKLKLCLGRQEDIKNGVKDLQRSVDRILDIQTKVHLDKKRRAILKHFLAIDPRDEYQTNIKLRHPMTGLWLTEGQDFDEWYSTPGSNIWCSGIPGAGKSVLAASVIQECLHRSANDPATATAYFFCTYRNSETHSAASILSVLCAQLALQDENAFALLEEYYDELKPDFLPARKPSEDHLTITLQRMVDCFDGVYLIVDGLDECLNNAQDSTRTLVALSYSRINKTMNMALFSRDELNIRQEVEEKFRHVEIEAHTEDVQLYVATELESRIASRKLRLRDVTLKDHLMNRLVTGAKGMFRWVACQLDHLCELPTDRARKEALDELPPTLPASYERILMRANGFDERVQCLVQRTLLVLASPIYNDMTFQHLCQVVSLSESSDTLFDDEIVEEEEILHWCSSLVRRSNGRSSLVYAHFTVREYLEQGCAEHPTLHHYSVSQNKACELLGTACLRYLTLENLERRPEATQQEVDNIIQRASSGSLYEHAAICWPAYLFRYETNLMCYEKALLRLFNIQKTPSFCTWVVEKLRHCLLHPDKETFNANKRADFGRSVENSLTIISAVLRPDFTPLHMAAALGIPHVCRYLLKQGASPTLRSRFGTPLHCAIGAFCVFADEHPFDFASTRGELRRDLSPAAARRETLQILLEAGAKPESRLTTPFWTSAVLSLVVASSDYGEDFEMVADLLRAGATVEDEDLEYFYVHYEHALQIWKLEDFKDFINGKALVNVWQALEDRIGENSSDGDSLTARLVSLTRRFMKKMGLAGADSQYHATESWVDGKSDEEVLRSVRLMIEDNDVRSLEAFLASGRRELIHSFGTGDDRGWTTLHYAIQAEATDVLRALLAFGIDFSRAADDGRCAMHLCWHDDDAESMRALLDYGASTCLLDGKKMTVWHYAAEGDSSTILKVLTNLAHEERDKALRIVSSEGQTPICAALDAGHEDAVLVLLEYCISEEHWNSNQSIFEGAARIGAQVVRAIIEAGLDEDGVNADMNTNPLHSLGAHATLECVELLKPRYSLTQRRSPDHRTPLELFLTNASHDKRHVGVSMVHALLPSNASAVSEEARSLWNVSCTTTVLPALVQADGHLWFRHVLHTLIEAGITQVIHDLPGDSPLLSFIRPAVTVLPAEIQRMKKSKCCPRIFKSWTGFSNIVLGLIRRGADCQAMSIEMTFVRLLCLAILHDDGDLISLLMEKGVSVYSKVDDTTPLELACLPEIKLRTITFDSLADQTASNNTSSRCQSLYDSGPLYCTAGLGGSRGSVSKLMRLLSTGMDCNLPSSNFDGTVLVAHVLRGAVDTAEILLDQGADPWAKCSKGPLENQLDAVAAAVYTGQASILEKIASTASPNSGDPDGRWKRTWSGLFGSVQLKGGNALHLAAAMGRVDCIQVFLGRMLLVDLDVRDNDSATPLHLAAKHGHHLTVKFLAGKGCDINSTDCRGLTPLHWSIYGRDLETVKTLIQLEAKHQVSKSGCTPLVYAYYFGNSRIIEMLEESSTNVPENATVVTSPRVVQALADGLRSAILQNNFAACQRLCANGCPVNIEIVFTLLNRSLTTTALGLAIYKRASTKIIGFLLENGAAVSVVFPRPFPGPSKYFTALELALASNVEDLGSLLPEMTKRYFEETNTLDRPLHYAMHVLKTSKLIILLDVIQDAYQNESRFTEWVDLLNRGHSGCCNSTPLQIAARRGDIKVLAALIGYGASINTPSERPADTALHLAASYGGVKSVGILLSHGAFPGALNHLGQTPLLAAGANGQWEVTKYLITKFPESIYDTDARHRTLLHVVCGQVDGVCDKGILCYLLLRGLSLYQPDDSGISTLHHILSRPSPQILRFLVNLDPNLVQPLRMPAWSNMVGYHKNGPGYVDLLLNFVHNLRRHNRLLGREEKHHLLGMVESNDHTLLCGASLCGMVGVVRDLIALEPQLIHHRCREHCTPLQAALSRHQLEAAKIIVRFLDLQSFSSWTEISGSPAALDPQFVRWHFVGRHLERSGISSEPADGTKDNTPWSGPWLAEVPLKWEWRKSRMESMWEYASRRDGIVRNLRGKANPVVQLQRPSRPGHLG